MLTPSRPQVGERRGRPPWQSGPRTGIREPRACAWACEREGEGEGAAPPEALGPAGCGSRAWLGSSFRKAWACRGGRGLGRVPSGSVCCAREGIVLENAGDSWCEGADCCQVEDGSENCRLTSSQRGPSKGVSVLMERGCRTPGSAAGDVGRCSAGPSQAGLGGTNQLRQLRASDLALLVCPVLPDPPSSSRPRALLPPWTRRSS